MNRVIIVEEGLLDGIRDNINRLAEAWKNEGADQVSIISHPKGVNLDPSNMRGLLQSVPNLEGALLIGELPVARMALDPLEHADHSWMASDYFFMELEGAWTVDSQNFVSCQEYLPPTIFVGRLVVGEDTGSCLIPNKPSILDFYNRYLEKLIAFRVFASTRTVIVDGKPELVIPPASRNGFKACLVDNWSGDTQMIVDWMSRLYPRGNISSFSNVNKDQYKNILESTPFDYMAFRCHSGPMWHDLDGGTLWNGSDYLLVNDNVNFFELTACDTGSLVWETSSDPLNPASPKILKLVSDLLAWNIQFAIKGGLIVLAPTISMPMNFITVFYDTLVLGGTFGSAFKSWAEYMQSFGDPSAWAFTLIYGDPFIRFGVPNYNCVIYTSLMGTPLEPKISVLQRYRDTILKKRAMGELLVKTYYVLSPFASKMTMRFRPIRSINRAVLSAIITVFHHARPLLFPSQKPGHLKTSDKIALPSKNRCDACRKKAQIPPR
nr:CFI-box-CTERM domain-containing protein [Candidatus Sigynarchaeota archaeon]